MVEMVSRHTKFIILGLTILAIWFEIGLVFFPNTTAKFGVGDNMLGAVLPGVLNNFSNSLRESAHLNTLKENTILDQAAQMKAEDMAGRGYFAHYSPTGVSPWYWFNKVGYKYDYAGENLAVNFTESLDVTNAWMNSPTHKENILKPVFTEVGTGVAYGLYKGKPSVFVVQLYATPHNK